MDRSAAETLVLKALAWCADGDGLTRFLAASGLDADDLRARASDPELLAAFLDFLLADESLCAAFCEAEAAPPERLHQARRALPGGALDR